MYMKVRALSSEGRMTGWMLSILPIFSFLLLFSMSPRFFLDVANDPWFVPGFVLIGINYIIGVLIIRKMIDLKV
jgi:tight adherence protein B